RRGSQHRKEIAWVGTGLYDAATDAHWIRIGAVAGAYDGDGSCAKKARPLMNSPNALHNLEWLLRRLLQEMPRLAFVASLLISKRQGIESGAIVELERSIFLELRASQLMTHARCLQGRLLHSGLTLADRQAVQDSRPQRLVIVGVGGHEVLGQSVRL